MSKMTRKLWRPTALMLALGIIGALAVFAAVAAQPGVTHAQGNVCDSPFASLFPECQGGTPPSTTPPTDGGTDPAPPAQPPSTGTDGDMIDNSSTSASATVELKLTIASLPMNAVAGSSVELYLEDDFQLPDSIARDTVYFTVNDRNDPNVGGGGRVYATDPVEIDDDDHFGGDDDWSIRVFVPDMNDAENSGFNGPARGDSVTLVFTKAAGIMNPSEAGSHSVGYSVLGPNDGANDGPQVMNHGDDNTNLAQLSTYAKISLSDEDNKRGYELTVTGSGFNNGTTAGVYVLNRMPMGDDGAAQCMDIILNGANPGGVTVGSDDKAAVTLEVTVPTFMAGTENYICMVDGEGRMSHTDIEQFHLEASVKAVPSTVATGDTVNVFAYDFPMVGAGFMSSDFKVAGQTGFNGSPIDVRGDSIGRDNSATATFVVPGGLKGTVRVDAKWGETSKNTKITIVPSAISLSKEEVAPNESVTIRGSGFGDGQGCLVSANISGAPLMLVSDDDPTVPGTLQAGQSCIDVEVSSAGQFAATVAIWADGDGNNPALTAGTHTIEVVDDEGFSGSATIIIREPTLMITPDVAGPRDYITISGENWPVENDDGGRIDEVVIDIDSGADDEDADPDASGRWSVTYRVAGDVVIPSTIPIKASYGDGQIVEVGSFAVPQASLTVDPMRAVPGDTITLSATGLSLFESDISVKIGSLSVSVPDGSHTNADGAIEGLEILVPSLEEALYTVQLTVKDTVSIGELTVMDDRAAGVPQPLPDALMEVGDNLEAVFYFSDATKSWQVFDPRPEWADLNTLTELVSGEAYWILVKENQDDVVLNGRLRSLTCSGDNCWNLEVW